MRSAALAAALTAALAAGACVPPRSRAPVGGPVAGRSAEATAPPAASAERAPAPIRVVSAAGATPGAGPLAGSAGRPIRVVSAASLPLALRGALPAAHRDPAPAIPRLAQPADLRALVGARDPRDPEAAAIAWARELGAPLPAAIDSGARLVAWAAEVGRLLPATAAPAPGDLLIFDRARSDAAADLIAIAVARDPRGAAEIVYLGGGVVRRGRVDGTRPRVARDRTGATLNTFLRHGDRWPPPGSRGLAGELVAHVVRLGRALERGH